MVIREPGNGLKHFMFMIISGQESLLLESFGQEEPTVQKSYAGACSHFEKWRPKNYIKISLKLTSLNPNVKEIPK